MLTAKTHHPMRSRSGVSARVSSVSQTLSSIDYCNKDASSEVRTESLALRPIRDGHELDAVHRLTYDSYRERGYCRPTADGRLIHYPHLDQIKETTVIVALMNDMIVGTNSFTFDGPNGLHVDPDFKMECDAIRAEGRKLAASWRIATCLRFRNQRKLVMRLIHETAWRMFDAGMETCVFTFHPRHERIYQRLLNMETIARKECNSELLNAPAVFMRMDLERCPERWKGKPR